MSNNVPRFLISTANETTWPRDKDIPVLFLGEWCKRYSRKHIWEGMDYKTAKYHWDDRSKLYEDYKDLQILYEKLLIELTEKLNKIHSAEYSVHYWRIIVGPWLGYFVQAVFDRWYMLNCVIKNNNITGYSVLKYEKSTFIPNDMSQFMSLIAGDDWNEFIYGQLIEFLNIGKLSLEYITIDNRPELKISKKKDSFMKSYLKIINNFINKTIHKNGVHFFISSYIPTKSLMKLQGMLFQIPSFWTKEERIIVDFDENNRKWDLSIEGFKETSLFDYIIRKLIPIHIPKIYLEGYVKQKKIINGLAWPKTPKTIFTSDAYCEDDIFKIWAAEKVENKTPLIIGQHGGLFGTNKFFFLEDHQIKISNKWLSWGWDNSIKPKVEPVGLFKELFSMQGYNPNGNILIVQMALTRYSNQLSTVPIAGQWLNYYSEQVDFISSLPTSLQKKVLLRFKVDYGWDQYERYKDAFPDVKINNGDSDIRDLINNSRIIIATYNATTYLEYLHWNVPTIIFWNPLYWELDDITMTYFEKLKSVGIFHDTPESAAQQLIDVYGNVGSWWKSKQVQIVRKEFCYRYARSTDNLLYKLKGIIQNA